MLMEWLEKSRPNDYIVVTGQKDVIANMIELSGADAQASQVEIGSDRAEAIFKEKLCRIISKEGNNGTYILSKR